AVSSNRVDLASVETEESRVAQAMAQLRSATTRVIAPLVLGITLLAAHVQGQTAPAVHPYTNGNDIVSFEDYQGADQYLQHLTALGNTNENKGDFTAARANFEAAAS